MKGIIAIDPTTPLNCPKCGLPIWPYNEAKEGTCNLAVECAGTKKMPTIQIEFWLIWSNEHCGWWKPARHGYTESLNEAGLYTYEEALAITLDANRFPHKKNVPNEAMVPLNPSYV